MVEKCFALRQIIYAKERQKMKKLIIGQIVTAVGIKGEVKIYSYAEELSRFKKLKRLYIGTEEENAEHEILNVKYKGQTVIVKLAGIDDRNAAEDVRDSLVLMAEADLEELPEGVYYVKDMVGMQVVTDTGRQIGTLNDINTNTPQRLYEVQNEKGKLILIPGVDEIILDIDMAKRQITVKEIEGLYEI